MSIPILFFHATNPEYLGHTLKQAKNTNPSSDIILLGDDSNNTYDFVQHHNFMDYYDTASGLEKIFFNLSTNNPQFEYICFARWFIIRDFCRKHNIDKFFYCDSDVLLYCDITEEYEKFKDYRYTLTHNISAGIAFINNIEVLDDFCKLTMDIYSKRDGFNLTKCEQHFQNLQKHGRAGGVCDMTVWHIYRNLGNPGDVGETSAILNNSAFDHNINGDDGYETENGVKKVYWQGNEPYCKNIRLNRLIKFNCLHFQGGNGKLLIPSYAKASGGAQ